MTVLPEDEYLALSGLQHFAFCRRQWALIHIERQWAENLRTVEGDLLHRRARMNSRLRAAAIPSSSAAFGSSPAASRSRGCATWRSSIGTPPGWPWTPSCGSGWTPCCPLPIPCCPVSPGRHRRLSAVSVEVRRSYVCTYHL